VANYRFRYNPETLKYERLRISIWNVLISILAVFSFSFLILVGLLFLQNRFLLTSAKKTLLRENYELATQYPQVRQQVDTIRQRIHELTTQENALFVRLFSTEREPTAAPQYAQLLAVQPKEFERTVRSLTESADALRLKAAYGNHHFSESTHLLKKDLARLPYFPTIFPVVGIQAHQLVSGFGSRINPWHKGHYQHDGIDIAQPRESSVVATANGTVSLAKRSDLLAGYGNHVEVDHGNGFVTRYAHLGEIIVRQGQRVTQGTPLARMGTSGSSVAPHVHYEVMWRGHAIDPLLLISENIDPAQMAALRAQSKTYNQALD
jgi:murein DD-endopeptidase MepM/ murein hydrolase activator NlpD